MHQVLVIGAGKIGSLISFLLSHADDYFVFLADANADVFTNHKLNNLPNFKSTTLNADDPQSISEFVKKNSIVAIISSLPYYCNTPIAKVAADLNINYFDLTEDVKTTHTVIEVAKKAKSVFVPQCGLAPGFISIVANDLMQHFSTLDTVKMRVGALPTNVSNALQYSLTWSTDGLINEYGNLCQGIEKGASVQLLPLEDLETIQLDGLTYEAFNTSGGIGSLVNTYQNKVKRLNYKTIRYPGHCDKIRFLMNDLKLNDDRETLKRILESALPKTAQDVVLVYVSVTGIQEKQMVEENYVEKFYPKKIHGETWSAIQLTTASSISAIVDLVLNNPQKYHGFVKQEQFTFDELIQNRFGQYYAKRKKSEDK